MRLWRQRSCWSWSILQLTASYFFNNQPETNKSMGGVWKEYTIIILYNTKYDPISAYIWSYIIYNYVIIIYDIIIIIYNYV